MSSDLNPNFELTLTLIFNWSSPLFVTHLCPELTLTQIPPSPLLKLSQVVKWSFSFIVHFVPLIFIYKNQCKKDRPLWPRIVLFRIYMRGLGSFAFIYKIQRKKDRPLLVKRSSALAQKIVRFGSKDRLLSPLRIVRFRLELHFLYFFWASNLILDRWFSAFLAFHFDLHGPSALTQDRPLWTWSLRA